MVWRLGRPRAKFQQAPHLIQRCRVLTCGRGEGGPWGLSYKGTASLITPMGPVFKDQHIEQPELISWKAAFPEIGKGMISG